MDVLALFLALALGLVHLLSGKLRFLNRIPRSGWLSFASGISVAYVFVHLLPELAAGQNTLREAGIAELVQIESHVWIIALLGLAVFYGLERAAKVSRRHNRERRQVDAAQAHVFWLHMGSFGLYNVLIGYLLLHRPAHGMTQLLLFWFAMLLHFFVNDYGLRQDYSERYHRVGRWLLAAAVVLGYAIALYASISEVAMVALTAFLGGGVVLNVLKEELPEERRSSFVPFAIGVAAYTVLLLFVG